MRNKLKMLPVMFYPYIYMICLVMYCFICFQIDDSSEVQATGIVILLIIAIVCNLYALIVVVVNLIMAVKGNYNAIELVKMNMIIKLVHIPAYIIHFLLGMLGLLASVWGIGFILWAITIDLVTIGLTGMVGVSASVCCKKEGILSKSMSWLYAFSSFIYCVDVISAIVFFVKVKKSRVGADKV